MLMRLFIACDRPRRRACRFRSADHEANRKAPVSLATGMRFDVNAEAPARPRRADLAGDGNEPMKLVLIPHTSPDISGFAADGAVEPIVLRAPSLHALHPRNRRRQRHALFWQRISRSYSAHENHLRSARILMLFCQAAHISNHRVISAQMPYAVHFGGMTAHLLIYA